MTLKKYLTTLVLMLCVSVILISLVACEPLAPEQTTQYVVVTGETPESAGAPSVTPPLGEIPVMTPVAGDATAAVPLPTTIANAGGAVNTPVSSATPMPPPMTPTPFICTEKTGRVIQTSFSSAIIGGEVPFRMYQPPCFFETLRRYPYVILLHGTDYDESMWEELGAPTLLDQGIKQGTLPPMVLIMPDGDLLFETNNQPDGASYESVMLQELIPAIERDFCLWGNRQGRAIGGISRGGFWAFSIAFRHPELFSAVGGHSPFFAENNAEPDYNPLDLAAYLNPDKLPLRIYMDNSANDYVGTNVLLMSSILSENGVEHEYLINPTGNHDMDYWMAHVEGYLAFYGQDWPSAATALPSCLEPSPES